LDKERLEALIAKLSDLSPSKLALIEKAVARYALPIQTTLAKNVRPFTKPVVEAFGDSLLTHHAMSSQPFTKDKFEYALIAAFLAATVPAEDSGSRTRAGFDISVAGVPWSLKTQANRAIRPDEIWISKFMEMGRGQWATAADLPNLRDRFLHHMQDYERIFTLRHQKRGTTADGEHHLYELIEIPKALMQEASGGEFEWMADSHQNPKPGYCRVPDHVGGCKFELYFDGGTERKLQIKHLKMQYCALVATWQFAI
jgi:type II restriction enzyme